MVSCSIINTENDARFDNEGYAVYTEEDSVPFTLTEPSKVKFYFEVSGSMNGFFRSNKKTDFKRDVYDVLSRCSAVSEIYVLEDIKGEKPKQMSEDGFLQAMNTGMFDPTGSTILPDMLNNIMSNLNATNGEVSVFVSDMRYDPIGQKGADVLVTQYSPRIAKMFRQFGNSVSMVCTTSNFLDGNGNIVTKDAPYYFVIMGQGPEVARVRNLISAVLDNKDRFIDNIEAGFDYGRPIYSFGVPRKCYQLDDQPTFIGYEDEEEGDTCSIKLKVPIENYRWLMLDEQYFKDAFIVKSSYGSKVKVSSIDMDRNEGVAVVIIKVFGMVMDSEVLEWGLVLPDTDYTRMSGFFEDANDPNDPTKSFSVKEFCEGMFGGLTNKIKPNYILISKKN